MPQGSESFRPIAPFASIAATFGISPWIKRRQPEMSSSAFFASGVFLAGTFGDFLGGVASDRVFESTHSRTKARHNLIMAGFLITTVFLAPVLLFPDFAGVLVSVVLTV